MNARPWLLMLVAAVVLGCSPSPPIRIGLMAGLSERTSDTGKSGRNGLMLAVELRNLAGGVGGRQLELVVQDNGQDADTGRAAINALIAAQVDAVIGPFTSAMAAVALPAVEQARLTMISPTANSVDLVGKDDFLIRMNRTTKDNAEDYAKILYQRGQRRVSVAYDTRNRSFSASWLGEFKRAFMALGGSVVAGVPFASQADTGFGEVVRQMLAAQPDGLLFIASAIDVARLAQQAHKMASQLPESASEWASSDLLIELGGPALEGLLISQLFNRDDSSKRYREFHADYVARFARQPDSTAIASYDAARVLMQALERRASGQSLKDAVLQNGPYQGLQQSIQFDRFGDTLRKLYFAEIHDGQFVLVKE